MSRRFAIADIHGCARTFRRLLAELELQQQDEVYLLGDYIDRGPDSRGVLDTIMELVAADYAIRPLLGNHEKLFLNAFRSFEDCSTWHWCGGGFTLQSFGVRHPQDIPAVYRDFLATLPTIAVTDEHVLVHAGLHFRLADPINDTPEYFRLWERDYTTVPELIGNRTLVVGHTVTDIHAIVRSLETCCIRLDNGCYDKGHVGFGSLVALDLDSRKLLSVPNCD